MQIFFLGDSLIEMSNPILWKKKMPCLLSAEIAQSILRI